MVEQPKPTKRKPNRHSEKWKETTLSGSTVQKRGDVRSREVGIVRVPKKSRKARKPNVEKTTLNR